MSITLFAKDESVVCEFFDLIDWFCVLLNTDIVK